MTKDDFIVSMAAIAKVIPENTAPTAEQWAEIHTLLGEAMGQLVKERIEALENEARQKAYYEELIGNNRKTFSPSLYDPSNSFIGGIYGGSVLPTVGTNHNQKQITPVFGIPKIK